MNWNEVNVSDVRFIAFDTETTGVNAREDAIVEIAAMSFDEDFEHRTFQTLVNPGRLIPPEVIAIHGITDEMVTDAPPRPAAMTSFFEFLASAGQPHVLVAHNAGFDVGFVQNQSRDIGSGFQKELVLDSCMLAKVLLPDLSMHRLELLADYFEISKGTLHRAAEDVRILKEVFMRLLGLAADKLPAGQAMTVGFLVDLCCGYFELEAGSTIVTGSRAMKLPEKIQRIADLCGQDVRIGIVYDTAEEFRYITPIAVKMRGFKVFIEAHCHRDEMKKSFRADRIKSIEIRNVNS